MSKAFDTINIHILIRKMLQTNIADTIMKFIPNYTKGRKAYTTYRNHTSIRQFKTGVPQGGVLSPSLFNIHAADLPLSRAPVQVVAYADDITITSTHTRIAWSSGLSRGLDREVAGSRLARSCVGAQVKYWSHVVIWTACKRTHNKYVYPL